MSMPKRSSPERGSPCKRLFNVPGNQNGRLADENGASAQAFTEIEHVQSLSKLSFAENHGCPRPLSRYDFVSQNL